MKDEFRDEWKRLSDPLQVHRLSDAELLEALVTDLGKKRRLALMAEFEIRNSKKANRPALLVSIISLIVAAAAFLVAV
jgi:hypothetical protein